MASNSEACLEIVKVFKWKSAQDFLFSSWLPEVGSLLEKHGDVKLLGSMQF